VDQPLTYEERVELARKTAVEASINIPLLVDEIDNPVWCTYGPAPNIAYLIGTDGRIIAKQGWYDPKLMEQAITIYLEESGGEKHIQNMPSLLPTAGFIIEHTRSDPNRAVREFNGEYTESIIDTHVHLDPPSSGSIDEGALKEIVMSIDSGGVDSIVVMPVPNEGIMSSSSIGTEQRKVLRQVGEDKIEIKIFCGSEYISNWLHDVYRDGYSESELNNILSRLSKDLNDPECSGIGEIGLYHFNKTGRQNTIEYPPTFVPFIKIIGLIAEKDLWIDLHAEPVDPDGVSYEDQVFGGLELLFQKYPNLKLILSHTVMTNPTNVRRILETYPNVMMNFKPITNHNKWRNLEPITNSDGLLYSDWAEIFEEMPERFVVGSDMKFGRPRTQGYDARIKAIRGILGSINPDAAKFIAYKNAERIFK